MLSKVKTPFPTTYNVTSYNNHIPLNVFNNRQHAGRELAKKLEKYKGKADVVVIGLPRGGVVTAAEVAKELEVPLDIIVPRKIGAPGNPELAIGAITEEGEGVFDQDSINMFKIPPEYIDREVEKEQKEAKRRLSVYRGDRPALDLSGKTALLVDDGVATGSTMQAAILSARLKGADKVVVAVPVTSSSAKRTLEKETDEFISVDEPPFFGAVGAFFEAFEQTGDDEVMEILKAH